MSNQMIAKVVLIVAFLAAIGWVLVPHLIRMKDFRDQAKGKKAERKLSEDQKISYDPKPKPEDLQTAIDREVLKTRSAQNLLGPK